MQYVGKRGDYYFYKSSDTLKFLDALPEVQPDHIIAGGASVAVLMGSGRLKDIDVWVSGDIPRLATRESEFAFNYDNGFRPPVQYMKVKATTPSKLLDSFDIDACKCAIYNITDSSYSMVLHKFLKPLVYGEKPTGICGVNPEAYNRFSTMRFHKYAMKFKRSPMDMYLPEDYAKALKLSEFSTRSIEEISQAIEGYAGEDQYEMLDHLRSLFDEQPIGVTGFLGTPIIGNEWAFATNMSTPIEGISTIVARQAVNQRPAVRPTETDRVNLDFMRATTANLGMPQELATIDSNTRYVRANTHGIVSVSNLTI